MGTAQLTHKAERLTTWVQGQQQSPKLCVYEVCAPSPVQQLLTYRNFNFSAVVVVTHSVSHDLAWSIIPTPFGLCVSRVFVMVSV